MSPFVCVCMCVGAICSVCAGSLDDTVCHWPAVCPGGESGQQRDHCTARIPLPLSLFGTQCIIVCVYLLQYMVCTPVSIYGVCACFHIWCVHLLQYMVCVPVSIYGVSPVTVRQPVCLHGTLTALLGIFGHSCGGCLARVASRSKAFAQVSCSVQ